MADKVKVSGRITWVGQREYRGKPYWRVGIVPDGEDKNIFLNVGTVDAPGKKGEHVTLLVTQDALDKAYSRAGERTKEEPKGRDDRITKSVALKAAADAAASIPHTDVSALLATIKRLAAEFESYLTGETPF